MATRFLPSSYSISNFPGPGQLKKLNVQKINKKSSEEEKQPEGESKDEIEGIPFHDFSKYDKREIKVEKQEPPQHTEKGEQLKNVRRKYDDKGELKKKTPIEEKLSEEVSSAISEKKSFLETYKYYLIGGGLLAVALLSGKQVPQVQIQDNKLF